MTAKQRREMTRRTATAARRAMAKLYEVYGFNADTAKGVADKAVAAAIRRAADAEIALYRAA